MVRAQMLAVDYYLPERVLTNDELADKLEVDVRTIRNYRRDLADEHEAA